MITLHIGTTRFNNSTYEENIRYRKNNDITGCIYGLPVSIPTKVKRAEMVYVIEMNTETKKIVGIGKVSNSRYRDKYYRIYNDNTYNRCIYKGRNHISRENIENKEALEILERVLFKGKGHMCRGHGITRLNPNRLKENKEKIIKFLKKLFI